MFIHRGLMAVLIILLSECKMGASASPYEGLVEKAPVEIKAGESFRFDCAAGDVERQRIDIGVGAQSPGKIDWSLMLSDTVANHTIVLDTKLMETNKYDIDHEESIEMTLWIDGKEALRKDFGHKLPISRSPIYVRLLLDGRDITLMAGEGNLDYAGRVPYAGFVNNATLSAIHGIVLRRHSALYLPVPNIPMLYPGEEAVYDALEVTADPRCHVWEFFDEEVETKTALKGGRYRLALLPSGKGGYDLIYISGAEVDSFRWCSGALKGYLEPTPFADNFTLHWIDSSGKEIDDRTPYASFEGMIMNLVFPLQKARLRFVKAD